MAITTTIYLSKLEFGNRFDGELYNPHLLKSFNVLKNSGYELLSLGSFCSIKSGTTPKDRDDSLQEGPVLFKTTDVRNNVMSAYDSFYHISDTIHNRMSVTKIKPYDVLLNIVGATLDVIGRSSIIMDDFQEANITQAMVFLRIKKKILPGYLFAFLNTKYAQDQIKRFARPTGQYNLNLMEAGKILIPNFDIIEQSRIEDEIKKSALLQEKSKSLFLQAERLLSQELQLDKLNISSKKWYTTDYSEVIESKRLDSNHFKDVYTIMFDFLKSRFNCKRIGQIVNVNRRGLQPIYSDKGNVMVVNSKHLSQTHINYDQTEKTTIEEFSKQSAAQIKYGDVLIYTTGAYIGLTNAFNSQEKALASNHVNILRLSDNTIDPNYLALVLNSVVGKLQTEKHSRGSAQLELYPADIAKFIVPIIDGDLMSKIGELVRNSLTSLNQSKKLLSQAKQRVEELIEKEVSKNKKQWAKQ